MIKELDLVVVPVSDQDAALEFYCQRLGFEKRADERFGEDSRWVEVAPLGGSAKLALMPPPRPDSPQPGQNTGVSFTTDDVDADRAQLESQGVDIDEVMRMEPPVPPMTFFRDPDGNSFLLVQRDSE